jgi:BlaI family penicillinase repressor
MSERPEISNAEWQVMNVVWEKQPVTARTIIDELSDSNAWTPATIRTFLHRLVKKGALTFTQDGNRYLYRAAVTRSATVKHAGKSFLASVFSGEGAPLLTHFVKSTKLSSEEIQQLRDLLAKKESE